MKTKRRANPIVTCNIYIFDVLIHFRVAIRKIKLEYKKNNIIKSIVSFFVTLLREIYFVPIFLEILEVT